MKMIGIALVIVFFILDNILGFSFVVPYRGNVCLYETIDRNADLSINFEVSTRDQQNTETYLVDFYILDKKKKNIYSLLDVTHGEKVIDAKINDVYTYCFLNKKFSKSDLEVFVNQNIVYKSQNESQLEMIANKLFLSIKDLKSDQEYLAIREKILRNIAESSNSRIKWWSFFQIFMVGVNSVFQVYFLKRFFDSKSKI